MKRNAIVRIILYSILALIFTALLLGGIAGGNLFVHFGGGSSNTVDGEVHFDPTKISKLEIDWAAGSVDIRVSNTDQIIVSEVLPEGSKYKMTYKVSGDTLHLEYSDVSFGFGFGSWNMPKKDLIIAVPQDWICQELEIDGAALEIDILALTVKQLDLDGAACKLNYTGILDQVDIDGASAEVSITCQTPLSQVNMDGASCKLELILPNGCGFYAQLDGLSCKFRSDLPYTMQGDAYCYGSQDCRIQADGVACSVTVNTN